MSWYLKIDLITYHTFYLLCYIGSKFTCLINFIENNHCSYTVHTLLNVEIFLPSAMKTSFHHTNKVQITVIMKVIILASQTGLMPLIALWNETIWWHHTISWWVDKIKKHKFNTSLCFPASLSFHQYKLSYIFRYELSGTKSLNFVLKNSLGGGGIASLRSDPQVSVSCYAYEVW